MIVIVDFDGTLALGQTSSIKERMPNKTLIDRLHKMKQSINPTIKVVTARGARDNLTTKQKNKRYRQVIEEWLAAHQVPYDELSFNKEYGSLYIDDLSINQFERFNCFESHFTKNKIIVTETKVVKYTINAANEHRWYSLAKGYVNVPYVYSSNQDMIVMEKIETERKPTAQEIIELIQSYKCRQIQNQCFSTYISHVSKQKLGTEKTRGIIASLPELEPSFFHGDLSTQNVLVQQGSESLYCIDPSYKGVFGNYLTDAAKAYFSFIAYEKNYQEAEQIADAFGKDVVRFAVAEGLRVCRDDPKYISIVNNIADLV